MNKLIWVTDPHLNFLGVPPSPSYDEGYAVKKHGTPFDFGKNLRRDYPDAEACIITGDIAEADCLERHLSRFYAGWQLPTFIILGNHDYYGSSIEAVQRSLQAFLQKEARGHLGIVWLQDSQGVKLSEDTVLCGNDGWYDGRAGNAYPARIIMSDFHKIKDFRPLPEFALLMRIREIATEQAVQAEKILRSACERFKRVIFATHVPPFIEATFHEGAISNNDWLPWMCNVTMGDHLLQVAAEYPDNQILVLCGHTHSPGTYKALPNLTVQSGSSKYWYPRVAGTIDLASPAFEASFAHWP